MANSGSSSGRNKKPTRREAQKIAEEKKRKREEARRRREEAAKKEAEKDAEEIRQAQKTVVTTEAEFYSYITPVTFDPASDSPLERFHSSVRAVIRSYVDTSQPASSTPVFDSVRGGPFIDDYFLLTGQLTFNAQPWEEKVYETGSMVRYLGEVYYAVNNVTEIEPPVKTFYSHGWPCRLENDDWIPIGRSGELSSPARRLANPNMGFVNGQWQGGTQGDTWLVSTTPGKNEIYIWDMGALEKVLSPNTVYQISKVDNSPSWASGFELPVNLSLFPPGTTFKTNSDLKPPFETTQPCIVPRSTRTNNPLYTAQSVISQIYISTMPLFGGVMTGPGEENGIYQYKGPDIPLKRLAAHDGLSGAPKSYEYLVVNEDNRDESDSTRINRPWMSDDANNWQRAESGILIGKHYGDTDIPRAQPPWRTKDSVVGEEPREWSPQVVYYPNDRTKFGGLEFSFDISDQSGLANISPMESDFWIEVDPTGVSAVSYIDGYRVNTITIEDFEMQSRMFGLVIPDKAVTISSLPLSIGNISFEVSGEYSLVYASTFNENPTAFSSRTYRGSTPITFTLNPAGVDVLRVQWDFGDGTAVEIDEGLSVTHAYSIGSLSPVPMKVTAKVTATNGIVYRTSRRINLQKVDVGVVGLPIVVD